MTSVGALLVSHDGARWLPAVLTALTGQQSAPDRLVGVDTGSLDDSADQLRGVCDEVVEASSATSFPQAILLGLAQLADCDWIWLLHDDSSPAPDALAALLAAAADRPDADILGPKLREWPSLRRLLEVGVTISGTGQRETGLERGEYDQGQHDEIRQVLAVNTAGMLVRRTTLEALGGFEEQLPVFGNDVDFGWRAAVAGHLTLVVPSAVVFHAEAAHRGLRRTALTGKHTHYQERRAALFTLLANGRAATLPIRMLRLALGTLLRVIGFVLTRQVGTALDELAALGSLAMRPGRLLAARRARRDRQPGETTNVRPLLAPPWLPYRHGLDFISEVAGAVSGQAQDVAERRRAAAAAAAPLTAQESRRQVLADGEDDEAPMDSGLVARFVTNPVALALAAFVVLVTFGARTAFGSVSGGGLSAAPAGASDLWQLYLESWHQIGSGTGVPAPAYLVPLAGLSTLLGGSVGWAVSALLLLAVPVSLWGAWRFLRVVGHLSDAAGAPRWMLAVGATAYALVPVVSGAFGDGRLGVVVVTALLPWLGHAALGFADPEADRRWRSAWRCGLLLALVASFTPVAWLFVVLLVIVILAVAVAINRSLLRDRSVWLPPLVALAVVPVLLAPWWLPALGEGAGAMLLLDAGRPPAPVIGFEELLLGRLAAAGAPWWLGLGLPIAAVLALIPSRTRIPVLVVWIVALVAAATTALLGAATIDLPIGSTTPGLSFFLVLLRACFLVAGFIAVHGLYSRAVRSGRTSRRLVPVLATTAVALVPVIGLAWFVVQGPGRLTDDRDTGVPIYMMQRSETGPQHGILVIRGDIEQGLTYAVRRGDGVTIGEDEILAVTEVDQGLRALVGELTSRPRPAQVGELAAAGIEYVVLPAPADGTIASGLDATNGLDQASAADRATRAWHVSRPVDAEAVAGPASTTRTLLLIAAGLALAVVIVLCLPSMARRRTS